ncbi:transposase [Streptomyces sp. SCSIO 30461]|uniref:transposase n=1 Tax=Streptomyces sp. SCSIO 30461 TaxID=3118085 RepID=UPI00387E47FE
MRDLNRLEFVGETLRAALEAVAVAAPQWLASWMPPAWQKQYGARMDSYRLPSDENERTQLTWRIAADGYGRRRDPRPAPRQAPASRRTPDGRRAVYTIRSGVEGTIHQAVTATGARRTRYAGLRKTALSHVLTATAINLIRIDAWWTGQPLAPTRTSHLAALDLAA